MPRDKHQTGKTAVQGIYCTVDQARFHSLRDRTNSEKKYGCQHSTRFWEEFPFTETEALKRTSVGPVILKASWRKKQSIEGQDSVNTL